MYDPIYTGWGNRTWLKGLIKGAFSGAKLRGDISKLQPTLRSVKSELARLKLNTDAGISRLAGMVTEDILKSFDDQIPDVEEIHLYHHVTASIANYFRYEQLFELPEGLESVTATKKSDLWYSEAKLQKIYKTLTEFDHIVGDIAQMYLWFLSPIIEQYPQLLHPQQTASHQLSFEVHIPHMLKDLPKAIERIVTLPFAPEFDDLEHSNKTRARLEYNVVLASGGNPADPNALQRAKLPTALSNVSPDTMIENYLAGTPFEGLLNLTVPIHIPNDTRYEHHHIVAGSGHGKTQTIQSLILHDLHSVIKGNASIVVLDSQGDLINNISNLSIFKPGSPLFERLVIVDPTDVEYPVALNLFDVKMERINQYSQLERERMINGILELYDFVLGSLLAAEMTQKQSVIFRYITRLMLHIPNATISTFRNLLKEDGSEKYREHIEKLEGSARDFFETEFDSREFTQTKKQVLRRLWGILENQSFERMFLHPQNKLDLFSEMNSGKVILVNTAKDLLKEEGTEIFGRFFIAMIAQAAQERSVIPPDQRMPTFVYIDEAADYFDRNIGLILSQARKYKVGMVLAHQFMGQMDSKLQDGVFANTSLRFAGGVSSKDARSLANEMRTTADFIESQSKLSLAAFVRGVSQGSFPISIKPGKLEGLTRLISEEKIIQRDYMREKYCVHYTQAQNLDEENQKQGSSKDHESDSRSESIDPDEVAQNTETPKKQTFSDQPEEW